MDASTTSLPLQAVRLLASYKVTPTTLAMHTHVHPIDPPPPCPPAVCTKPQTPATCDEALATALEWAVEPSRTNDDTTAVVLATILSEATDFENALRAVRSSKTLEP